MPGVMAADPMQHQQ